MRNWIIGGIAALFLGVALPASAHNDHGWRHGKHYHGKHHHHHHRAHGPRAPYSHGRPREINNYYFSESLPSAPPAAGVSVVFPEIFIPWR
jgi:hypothetical protein